MYGTNHLHLSSLLLFIISPLLSLPVNDRKPELDLSGKMALVMTSLI
jgi:hypothetical protein